MRTLLVSGMSLFNFVAGAPSGDVGGWQLLLHVVMGESL